MSTCALNYRDLLMVTGGLTRGGKHAAGPITPLSDGCGYVDALGEGVTCFEIGDRVSTLFYQGWIDGPPTPETRATALGSPLPGVASEWQLFSQYGLAKVPAFLSDTEVATLPCAALTAWHGLFVDADLSPGATVVLQGTGGVSVFGLQFATAAGYRTFLTSSSDAKRARAEELGADHTHNYRTTPVWSAAVRAATGGRGADFVMEVGGAETLQESLRAVKMGGHIAIVGIIGGHGAAQLNPAELIGTSAKLQGVSVGSREMFDAMCRFIEAHRIRPVIDKVMPWTEMAAALRCLKTGEHFGKIVLEF